MVWMPWLKFYGTQVSIQDPTHFNKNILALTQMIVSLFKLELIGVCFEQFYKSWDGKKCHLFLSGARELIKSTI